MNDKLRAWEGKISDKMVGRGQGRGGVKCDALVCIRKNQEKREDKTGCRDVMRVTFHRRMDALTGWKKGDILDMEIANGIATVFRSDKGARLCDSGSTSKSTRMYVRYSFPAGSLSDLPVGDCREVEAKPGKVAFLLPE